MKFLATIFFTLALVASTFAVPNPKQLIEEIEKIIPNLSDLTVSTINDIASSIKPGKCPETTRLPEAFKLNEFLGTWYEIERTNLIWEKGQRCVQANYKLDQATGNVIVNNSGVNTKDEQVYNVGTGVPTDKDNVLAVKFFPLSPSAQYWVVDTDYNGYALIVSCNDILGLFNISDTWILSRQPTLSSETVNKLKAELQKIGFSQLASQLTATVQNC